MKWHILAKRYDITFNVKKSQVIIYKAYNVKPHDPCVVIHLGHLLTENVYEFNVSKCIDDFNRQYNMFFADFKHCSCHIRIFYFNDIALISMALNYCLSLMSKYKNYILLGE